MPQSSSNLAQAVQFTVAESHGLSESAHRKGIENLINKVEDLINQIQRWDCRIGCDENLETAFGFYVAERAPREESIENVYYAIPLRYHDTQEAAASFARYMNLLERMVALFSHKEPSKKVDIIFEKSCEYLQNNYFAAVEHHRQSLQKDTAHGQSLQISPLEPSSPPERISESDSNQIPKTLSKRVEEISKKISEGPSD